MAAFKQEIYEELAEIDKMNSSAILSNSVPVSYTHLDVYKRQGLLNVQSSVKKYDGNLILKSDGNKFIAELFLNS